MLVAVLLAGVAGLPVYVLPQLDTLRPADAIVVLGGTDYQRYPYGLELALQGYAPQVVFSNPNGEQDVWLNDLCTHQRYTFTVTCFTPDPSTTRGEAEAVEHLAEEHGWRSLLVVTFRPHVSRARYILGRCFDGQLVMTDSPGNDLSLETWVWAYLYQTAGYVRAAFESGC
ncbi:YdcF family protein [Pseudonocardia kujensis]|uniref:YdcF family protein n=1 Tax=Pseudonocardia kujensis TaxID=1128675 RepID=UPI001E5F601F|nr:YdcF family protein [Pseudonocardia kujensis]MCE0763144.1 YdcF family protein [Pseudonocardia kujensis]